MFSDRPNERRSKASAGPRQRAVRDCPPPPASPPGQALHAEAASTAKEPCCLCGGEVVVSRSQEKRLPGMMSGVLRLAPFRCVTCRTLHWRSAELARAEIDATRTTSRDRRGMAPDSIERVARLDRDTPVATRSQRGDMASLETDSEVSSLRAELARARARSAEPARRASPASGESVFQLGPTLRMSFEEAERQAAWRGVGALPDEPSDLGKANDRRDEDPGPSARTPSERRSETAAPDAVAEPTEPPVWEWPTIDALELEAPAPTGPTADSGPKLADVTAEDGSGLRRAVEETTAGHQQRAAAEADDDEEPSPPMWGFAQGARDAELPRPPSDEPPRPSALSELRASRGEAASTLSELGRLQAEIAEAERILIERGRLPRRGRSQ